MNTQTESRQTKYTNYSKILYYMCVYVYMNETALSVASFVVAADILIM